MKTKTAEEFEAKVSEKGITKWFIHNCSMCQYACGYVFMDGKVYYDNGCYCTNGENLNQRSYEDVAGNYNMQSHPNQIKKMDKFWGFKLATKNK